MKTSKKASKYSFWSIHKHELKKFVPISLFMFCILFDQNVLRILKDSIVIPEISAEITSFAKVYCVTPAAAIFVIIYAKMVNHLSFEKIYYYLIIAFSIFFLVFAFYIYPNASDFHLSEDVLHNLSVLHPHLKWYIYLAGYWSYILFYVLSELWPNIFYVFLFWQFINQITSTEEASRFYTLFSLFGNSSLIIVGLVIMHLASSNSIMLSYFGHLDSKVVFIQSSITLIVVLAIFSALIVSYICRFVIKDSSLYVSSKIKNKLGLIDSFRYILSSKYLWLLLICSAAFGLSINLVEAVWKAKTKELYGDVNSYAEFSGLYILWTGVAIMLMTIIGNNIMKHHGWLITAVITPIIILITGAMFFVLVVFDKQITSLLDGIIIVSPIVLAVLIGTVQNVLSKGAKYSIWDTSIQMLYIPLDTELQTKGKAVVDVVSSKIGKASSGLMQSILFTIFPLATYSSISPILMVIFIIVCFFWTYAIRKIYHEYQKILSR